MKKSKRNKKDELRPEYEKFDFPGGMVRGTYAERLRESPKNPPKIDGPKKRIYV